ncbi:hypothetical protein ABJW20_000153 [Escherichia coli]
MTEAAARSDAPESEPILAAAESSFRKWLAEQGLIGQDVALSAIAAALHVHGVQRVEIRALFWTMLALPA